MMYKVVGKMYDVRRKMYDIGCKMYKVSIRGFDLAKRLCYSAALYLAALLLRCLAASLPCCLCTSVPFYLSTFLPFYLLFSCQSSTPDYAPKPKGYPRLDLPAQVYQPLAENHPYWFEYSKSAVIKPDTFNGAEPHWIFINYPSFNASIQLTYKPIGNNPSRLQALINDTYRMAGKHQIKATGMREQVLKTKSGRAAVVFELMGDVPSYIQFYTTDTTTHYLRGALYFTIADKQDSLQPAIDYLRRDIVHLLGTLKWKK
ncbi:MAG: gliding motility lipoprotein GldD [Runella sp.]